MNFVKNQYSTVRGAADDICDDMNVMQVYGIFTNVFKGFGDSHIGDHLEFKAFNKINMSDMIFNVHLDI